MGPDLSGFDAIVPCGIAGRSVTSLSRLLGAELRPEQVAVTAGRRIAEALGYEAVWDEKAA